MDVELCYFSPELESIMPASLSMHGLAFSLEESGKLHRFHGVGFENLSLRASCLQ